MTIGNSAFSSTIKETWDSDNGYTYLTDSDTLMLDVTARKGNDSSIYFDNAGYMTETGQIYSNADCFVYVFGNRNGDLYYANSYRGNYINTSDLYIRTNKRCLIRQYVYENGFNYVTLLITNCPWGRSRGTWSADSTSYDNRNYPCAN